MQWINRRALPALLRSVMESEYSGFYRDKYRDAGVSPEGVSPEAFAQLPLLTRGELVETPIQQRLLIPPSQVRFVAFTSGTSSSRPLLMPFSEVEDYYFEPSLGLDVSRPLIIHPPMLKSFGHTFMQQCRQAKHQLNPLFGDVQNLANSALVAAAVGCDAVYSIPTVAALFAPLARERGIAEGVRLLALSSETLTSARREELTRAYPNALIANLYGSTELGQLPFYPCPSMMERGLNQFHVLTDALAAVEIIEGELVVSYGLNRASPLIRYRTGDYFEEVPGGCDCGREGPVLQWSHRSNIDRLRLNGVEFDVEEADRAFARLPHLPRVEYRVHFRPASGAAVALEVEIAPLAARDAVEAQFLAQTLEGALPDAWQISSTATVRTALERGLLASFTVRVVPTIPMGTKMKRFVNHVA